MRKLIFLFIFPLVAGGYFLTRPVPVEPVVKSTPQAVIKLELKVPKIPELLEGTNQWRVENGLNPLAESPSLVASAQAKCQDMQTLNYWSHNRPDGTEPWVFIKNTGYLYYYAGENLAKGFPTAQAVTTGWKNSPKHNENLLNPNFTEVGYAVCEGPQVHLVIQHLALPR